MPITLHKSDAPILTPCPGCDWADTMVLNPAVISDPEDPKTYHMLFRATGPSPQNRCEGQPLPYPIFLGYAVSRDQGSTWTADFDRPALAPTLRMEREAIRRVARDGEEVVDYANGCIEDPRLFPLEGRLYLSTACRLFPPGPYWEQDEPMQCAPAWALAGEHDLGRAASANVTVNVLWEVSLTDLWEGRYEDAFRYVTHLTYPDFGENRDVVFFPEKFEVEGRSQWVMIHRPFTPSALPGTPPDTRPSIYLSHAEDLRDFAAADCNQHFLAGPLLDWEVNRIGASTAPLRISPTEWLLPYHGKQGNEIGYTQSFMILEDVPGELPCIRHRCPERLFIADQPWEQPRRFPIPCVFTTGAFVDEGDLVMSYGAADEVCGLCRTNLAALLETVRGYDAEGNIS